MTIPADTRRSGPYAANGATADFDFYFKIDDAAHVDVVFLASVDGSETTLTLTGDYTVSGVGDPAGGTVTLTDPGAVGQGTITLIRDLPLTQLTDLVNQGAYYAETVETTFDISRQVDLQQQEMLDRTLRFIRSTAASTQGLEFPDYPTGSGIFVPAIHAESGVTSWVAVAGLSDGDRDALLLFRRYWLGGHDIDPSVDGNGIALGDLQKGAIYYNTAVNSFREWNGLNWRAFGGSGGFNYIQATAPAIGAVVEGETWLEPGAMVGHVVRRNPANGLLHWVQFNAALGVGQVVQPVVYTFASGTLASSDLLLYRPFAAQTTFPANFAGSVAAAGSAFTANTVLDVYKRATLTDPRVAVGTITFAAGSRTGLLATTGDTAVTFELLSVIEIVAPASNDVTGGDIGITLIGERG